MTDRRIRPARSEFYIQNSSIFIRILRTGSYRSGRHHHWPAATTCVVSMCSSRKPKRREMVSRQPVRLAHKTRLHDPFQAPGAVPEGDVKQNLQNIPSTSRVRGILFTFDRS